LYVVKQVPILLQDFEGFAYYQKQMPECSWTYLEIKFRISVCVNARHSEGMLIIYSSRRRNVRLRLHSHFKWYKQNYKC
jgi:hypothetical protein